MVPDVSSVLRAPTAPPTGGTLLSMRVRHALLDISPCSGQAKLLLTAPLSAFVMLAMAHLQGVHRNVQSVPAPSIRVTPMAPLLPHLKALSLPVFYALAFHYCARPLIRIIGARETPTGLQCLVCCTMHHHRLVQDPRSLWVRTYLGAANSECPPASHASRCN
jgi:hypothetical protein